MTTDERKTILDIRNQLAAQMERLDDLLREPATESDLFGSSIAKPKGEPTRKPALTQEGLLRIRRIFGHRDTTLPDTGEKRDYNRLAKRLQKKPLYKQIEQMETFYALKPKQLGPNETNLWPQGSRALINKWDEVIARAKPMIAKAPKTRQEHPSYPEPKAWREFAANNFPSKPREYWLKVDWKELARIPGVQSEIIAKCR
jgi:hypothetical protein